jgi:hypothetical protein
VIDYKDEIDLLKKDISKLEQENSNLRMEEIEERRSRC